MDKNQIIFQAPERIAQSKIWNLHPNYIIYDDGRVFSIKRKHFLVPRIQYSKTGRIQAYHNLNSSIYPIARLVYFNFGKHDCQYIHQMPFVTHIHTTKDTNAQDFYIENLRLVDRNELNDKFKVLFREGGYGSTGGYKIKTSDKETVEKMYKLGIPVKKIAKKYNCGWQTVYKFMRKHKITRNKKNKAGKATSKL